ncbi:hypothetical protein ElyMa_006073100 [Elysia marginata]|uniref:Uncharacterized protein n=1 Tax=Elysia marginata TaxID=1093978 RepID=A0AAV4GPU6_9GAST|nr:hypothetical protein ElyMa_006073100 [Elysia marginata]
MVSATVRSRSGADQRLVASLADPDLRHIRESRHSSLSTASRRTQHGYCLSSVLLACREREEANRTPCVTTHPFQALHHPSQASWTSRQPDKLTDTNSTASRNLPHTEMTYWPDHYHEETEWPEIQDKNATRKIIRPA